MKKILRTAFLALLAVTAWGCAELDVEQVETGDVAVEMQGEQVLYTAAVQRGAQSAGDAVSAGTTPGLHTEAYYSCEGKSCGQPCGSGGYVCNIFGECTRQNPACD